MAPTVIVVDSCTLLNICISDLSDATKFAIDIEGIELCRNGRVSILQIVPDTSMVIYLIDVTTLQTMAFDHEDPEGRSLRAILQSEKTTKLFYDVRNDADALFNIYNINIANVYDLQLLDLAVQRSAGRPMRFVNGLARSIDAYLQPPLEWMRVKEEGVALFAPEKGGSYEIFDKRPMDPRIIAYCAQDVALLFELETGMEQRMGRVGKNWKSRVTTASAGRVGKHEARFIKERGGIEP